MNPMVLNLTFQTQSHTINQKCSTTTLKLTKLSIPKSSLTGLRTESVTCDSETPLSLAQNWGPNCFDRLYQYRKDKWYISVWPESCRSTLFNLQEHSFNNILKALGINALNFLKANLCFFVIFLIIKLRCTLKPRHNYMHSLLILWCKQMHQLTKKLLTLKVKCDL